MVHRTSNYTCNLQLVSVSSFNLGIIIILKGSGAIVNPLAGIVDGAFVFSTSSISKCCISTMKNMKKIERARLSPGQARGPKTYYFK